MYNVEEYERLYGENFVRQLEIEVGYKRLAEEATLKAYEATEQMNSSVEASSTTAGIKFIACQWQEAFEGMKLFVEDCLRPKKGSRAAYVLLMQEIAEIYKDKTDDMVSLFTFTTFTTLFNNILKKRNSHSAIAQDIYKELWREVRTQAYMDNVDDNIAGLVEKGVKKRVQAHYKNAYIKACMVRAKFEYAQWNSEVALAMAGSLIEVILATSTYFEKQQRDTYTEIVPTQAFVDAWQKSTHWLAENSYKLCPTIIPPREWDAEGDGGYYGELMDCVSLLRLHRHNDIYSKSYEKKLKQIDMSNVRKAVNAVQTTPWVINNQVLDVLQYVLEIGGGRAGIPLSKELDKPAKCVDNPDEKTLKDWKAKMVKYYRSESRRTSILLRVYSHLTTAKRFKDYEKIYFPCNMDFRGHIYPIPSFNFQGDDLNKSLLLFAEPPACQDETCYKWMLVEGANLAGVDKVSFDDRMKWVLDNEPQILAVADDPKANMWWADQDEPCQFLAWCFEYKKMKDYMASHNNSIVGFVTGLNVAFDGTCSGLQHFSAILRDPVGGRAVNLVPADKPSDIYGIVAEKVNKVLEQDLVNGTDDTEEKDKQGKKYTKHGTRFLSSIWLSYGVTRKVTKRSVMTLAYGSKEYGFKDQLLEDVIKPDKDSKTGDEVSVFEGCESQAARYLAKLIWKAVGTTVIAAVEGMKWLQDCARKVTKNNQVVTWSTPTGLLVQQAYMVTKSKRIFTRCAGKQIRIYDNTITGEIDNRKQASGVAPNFIHSMDAAHLQLTLCNCVDKGIHHFAVIHDSYAAPLAQAQIMFDTVRESFIQMYTEQDVFENFRQDLSALADEELPEPPKKGNLDINVVKDSLYIFS